MSTQLNKGRRVAIFGSGIAGLSAAHELVRLGYSVAVYEANALPGGFFRSARLAQDSGTPSEYSWHGMGPWYHNAFELMRQTPFDEHGSVYDRALSRPIAFGIFPDKGPARFFDKGLRSIPKMFGMTKLDFVRWSWLMLKTWASRRRSEAFYATLNAADAWKPKLSQRSYTNWRSCFGPWIGSDWTLVSLHTAGQFFRKQLICRPAHVHKADADGPAWVHGAGDGWLLLRGPSSEYWFERWVHDLAARGVEFHWNSPLRRLQSDGKVVLCAEVGHSSEVRADVFVLATDPFSAARIISQSPALEHERELARFNALIADGPHIQVAFRIAFSEPVKFPRARTAVVLADTEFNLTLFAEEQVWGKDVELGANVKSLWTGTSCVGTVPGRVHGLPVKNCTKEQFIEDAVAQILGCESLDALIREANGGRSLKSFPILKTEVWHEWRFDPKGIKSPQSKWVNTFRNQAHLPDQITTIPNLFLAGAHTRTTVDVWSIEGAAESGRRAARGIDARVSVTEQYKPLWLNVLSSLDDVFYRVGAPHFLDVTLVAACALAVTLTLVTLAWLFT